MGLDDYALIGAAILIVIGVALIWIPAAFIAAGLLTGAFIIWTE